MRNFAASMGLASLCVWTWASAVRYWAKTHCFVRGVPVLQPGVAHPRLGMGGVLDEGDRGHAQLCAEGVDLQAERTGPARVDRADSLPAEPRLGGRVGFAVEERRGGLLERGRAVAEHRGNEHGLGVDEVGRERERRRLGIGPGGEPGGRRLVGRDGGGGGRHVGRIAGEFHPPALVVIGIQPADIAHPRREQEVAVRQPRGGGEGGEVFFVEQFTGGAEDAEVAKLGRGGDAGAVGRDADETDGGVEVGEPAEATVGVVPLQLIRRGNGEVRAVGGEDGFIGGGRQRADDGLVLNDEHAAALRRGAGGDGFAVGAGGEAEHIAGGGEGEVPQRMAGGGVVGGEFDALGDEERVVVGGEEDAGVAAGLGPIVGPEELAAAIPDRQAEVAGAGDPRAIRGGGEVVDVIGQDGREGPVGQAGGQTGQGEAAGGVAVAIELIEVVSLAGVEVVTLGNKTVTCHGGGVGVVVADAFLPAGLAGGGVQGVEVIAPVEGVEEHGGAVARDGDVAEVRAEGGDAPGQRGSGGWTFIEALPAMTGEANLPEINSIASSTTGCAALIGTSRLPWPVVVNCSSNTLPPAEISRRSIGSAPSTPAPGKPADHFSSSPDLSVPSMFHRSLSIFRGSTTYARAWV